ncbi:MAG: hypothetical protein HY548_10095, partial [Elusimicrobia bacterium]|nr:hypothetical protein [Elusimicrobiota bacterium]
RNSRNSSYIFKVEVNEAVLETGEQTTRKLHSQVSGRWAWVSNVWGETAHAVTAALLGYPAKLVLRPHEGGAPYVNVPGLPQNGFRALVLAAVHPLINFLWALSPFLWLVTTGTPQGPPQIALFIVVSFHALLNAYGFLANLILFRAASDSDWNRIFYALGLSRERPLGEKLRAETGGTDGGKPLAEAIDNSQTASEALNFLRTVGIRPGDRVVNVGTSFDFYSPLAAAYLGAHYAGYDLTKIYQSPIMGILSRLRMGEKGGSAQQVLGSFSASSPHSASIPDRSQDVVLMLSGVLSDPIPESNAVETLDEALRVVKDGGKIVVGSYPDCWEYGEMLEAQKVINTVLNSPQWKGKVDMVYKFPAGHSRTSAFVFEVRFKEGASVEEPAPSPIEPVPAAGTPLSEEELAEKLVTALRLAREGQPVLAAHEINFVLTQGQGPELNLDVESIDGRVAALKRALTDGPFDRGKFLEALGTQVRRQLGDETSADEIQGLLQGVLLQGSDAVSLNAGMPEADLGDSPVTVIAVNEAMKDQVRDLLTAALKDQRDDDGLVKGHVFLVGLTDSVSRELTRYQSSRVRVIRGRTAFDESSGRPKLLLSMLDRLLIHTMRQATSARVMIPEGLPVDFEGLRPDSLFLRKAVFVLISEALKAVPIQPLDLKTLSEAARLIAQQA